MSAVPQGHEKIDRRSIELHRAIAEKLRAQPELLEIARQNIERQLAGRSRQYAEAWRELLASPMAEWLPRLVEDSERMRAMRQSTPFAGVLSAKERWKIYDDTPGA
jgi:hypothetical protein